jgi:hypothetical protein
MASERISRFFKNFIAAAGHCLWEADEVVVPVIAAVACASLFWLAYEVIFDSDSVNVASRLALLSIDPDKWV